MTAQQILALKSALSRYVDEFADCFPKFDTRSHLKEYVQGQLSDLPRKSVEPMAHLAQVPPRTLQEFLSLSDWDQERLRERIQQIVARDHSDEKAIGIVDESGHPKKGNKTACVQRQYCGNTGKIDNCVMSVHLSYTSYDNAFRTMIDSELFLEAKAAPFWMPREGKVVGPYWLIMARDVLHPDEVKYFLSNAAPGTPIEPILHVAFSRWPIERCLEDEKTELGLSHFECRKYAAVERHLLITQVSHLFLARQCLRLREKKYRDHDLSDSHRQRRIDRYTDPEQRGQAKTDQAGFRGAGKNSALQRRSTAVAYQGPQQTITEVGHSVRAVEVLHPAVTEIAL